MVRRLFLPTVLAALAAGTLALSVTACASTASPSAASIVEADEKAVVACEFVGFVSGARCWAVPFKSARERTQKSQH